MIGGGSWRSLEGKTNGRTRAAWPARTRRRTLFRGSRTGGQLRQFGNLAHWTPAARCGPPQPQFAHSGPDDPRPPMIVATIWLLPFGGAGFGGHGKASYRTAFARRAERFKGGLASWQSKLAS